jgi:UDP-4-amino-4,6-dideoxy-N-acetyl-beta-L-altrosamine N-acetyltransferase
VRPEDKEKILVWRNLPEVAKFMYSDHEIKPAEHDHWFVRAMADSTCRYWVITMDSEDVGLANLYGIDEHNRRCYWAFYLASSKVRGRGVGSIVEYRILSHVFDERRLNRLCCEVLGFNAAVIRMHETFGFRQEGVLRQHIYKDARFHDVVTLGMLRKDWEVNKAQIMARLSEKGLVGDRQ